jgi:hypothetical protein
MEEDAAILSPSRSFSVISSIKLPFWRKPFIKRQRERPFYKRSPEIKRKDFSYIQLQGIVFRIAFENKTEALVDHFGATVQSCRKTVPFRAPSSPGFRRS